MSRFLKVLLALILFIALVGVFAYLFFAEPYLLAENAMPKKGKLTIIEQENGRWIMEWPKASGADSYLFEVRDGDKLVYSSIFLDNQIEMPTLPSGKPLTVTITSRKDFRTLLWSGTRIGKNPLTVTGRLDIPTINNITYDIDIDDNSVFIDWSGSENDHYTLYTVEDGAPTELLSTYATGVEVDFGLGGELPVPEKGEEVQFALSVSRETDNIAFYSLIYNAFSVTREDLLGTVLRLVCTDEGDNAFTIRWNETRGDRYEVQRLASTTNTWETVAELDSTDELIYRTGRLQPFNTYKYRIVAMGGHSLWDTDEPVLPAECSFETKESVLYASIWPLTDLALYSDTSKSEVIGTAKEATQYCVLEESDGFFKIFCQNKYGYVDSNYCMINLPDYLGSLVRFDIKNSYDSIYKIHDEYIPYITGTVITGYENILTSDGYLAPLLYPTAKKILSAALTAEELGYRLKIYDSFRPRKATRFLFDTTEAILKYPVQDIHVTLAASEWDAILKALDEAAAAKAAEAAAETTEAPGEETVTQPEVTVNEDNTMTYYELMTNNTYGLGNFLARVGSYHNMGIAVDLTLETISSHTELQMQTAMHDLSWYAILSRNNSNAKLLSDIMTGAGLSTLISEWWHFQDNELRDNLGLKIYLESGVGPAGWKADDYGMRYRDRNGDYIADTTRTIDGVEYTFNADGYCVELLAQN